MFVVLQSVAANNNFHLASTFVLRITCYLLVTYWYFINLLSFSKIKETKHIDAFYQFAFKFAAILFIDEQLCLDIVHFNKGQNPLVISLFDDSGDSRQLRNVLHFVQHAISF